MRQFDVVRNPRRGIEARVPFLVSLQSHYLDGFGTVVIAPLIDARGREATRVDVPIAFGGRELLLAVSELTSTTKVRRLRPVGSLADRQDDIRRALERLFSGF